MRDMSNRTSGLGGLLRSVLLVAALVAGFGGAGAAVGEVLTGEFKPKDYSVVDGNGVDLAERGLNLSQSVSIGDPANGGLSYSASYSSSDGLWRYYQSVMAYARFDRVVDPDTQSEQSSWALHVDGKTEQMYSVSAPGAVEGEMAGELGSQMFLGVVPGMNIYYVASARLSDGTLITFNPAPITASDTGTIFLVTSATKPNGDRVDYHYGEGLWPRSITNSHGYQLRFEYVNPSAFQSNPTSVTLFNMAVDACDPDAASCPAFTKTWPKLTFEYQSNRPSAIVQTNGDRTTYTYGTASQRIEQVNGPGTRATSYAYQNCGAQPPYGTCNAGAETLGGYRLSTVSTGGRTWSYAWDPGLVAPGKLEHGTRVTSAAGSVGYNVEITTWFGNGFGDIYLPAARVVKVTDELNRTTKMEYVGQLTPRTSKVVYPEANGAEYTYDMRGNITRVRTFAKAGGPPDQVIEITRGESGTTAHCAQAAYCNKAVLIRDARGYVARNTWNATTGLLESTETGLQGPDTNLTCALGAGLCPKTVYGYTSLNAYYKNGANQLVAGPAILSLTSTSLCEAATTCAAGTQIVTSLDYGPAGVANNLLVRSQSAGKAGQMATTSFSYDEVGNRTVVDGPRTDVADVTRYAWDLNRRPTLETYADNSATRTAYNAEGYVESVAKGTVDGAGTFTALETASYLYDGGGNQTRVTTPAGVTQISYDGANRKLCTAVRMTPGALLEDACALAVPLASTTEPDRITRAVYDAAGQALQIREAVATGAERAAATYSYTLNGKREYVVDANGNRSKWNYDGFDRLSQWTFPSTVRPTAYNPASQVTALATAGALNTNDFEQYTYDASNNRASLRKRDTRTIGYSYDALNRMTVKDLPTGDDVYYGYDLRGLQLYARFGSAAISAAGLTSTYDALGRMASSSNNVNGAARLLSYEYDLAGNRTKLKYPDEQYVTFEYSAANRMTAIKENGTTTITGLGYNALGRRSELSVGVATTYGYDAAGRLNSLSHNLAGDARDVTFAVPSYNAASQAMSKSVSKDIYVWRDAVNAARDYRANGLNQYDLVGVAPFGYDANGNLTSDGAATYTYDVENRLTSVGGSTTLALAYDPLGRLSQTSGGSVGTTRFLYDGDALVAEYDGSGALLRRYVHGPGVDEPLVWYEGAGLAARRILRGDLQGSIVAVDANGAEIATNTYDEYGNPGANNQGRFAYTGQIRIPEIGMYYYKARIYSPSLGRFLQTDPIGYEDGLNWYAYVGNDPLNRTDPTGLLDATSPAAKALLRAAAIDAVGGGPANPIGDVIAVGVGAGSLAGDLGAKIGQTLRDNEKNPQMYYRALTSDDRASILAGKGIVATDPTAKTSINDHVENDVKPSSYISMTKSPAVAADYSSGNGVAVINPSAVSNKVDLSRGSPLLSVEGNRNAISDAEVLAKGYIPQGAISGILDIPRKK